MFEHLLGWGVQRVAKYTISYSWDIQMPKPSKDIL
jgi:hypothetical protein